MTNQSELSGDELARACADIMWENDKASRGLGITRVSIAQGQAELSMVVADHMTNGQGHCHGGFIFTLADSAFAFACNGYNQFTVAQHCTISFLRPALAGERLVARARELSRSARSGIYDVSVLNPSQEIIAEFRGNSRTVKGTHLPLNSDLLESNA